MRKLSVLASTGVLCFTIGLVGCGGDKKSSSGSSKSNDLTSVPKATDPVQSSTQSLALLATTGIRLADGKPTDSGTGNLRDWASGDSRGMCETTSMMKDLISEASTPDSFLCRVAAMRKHGVLDKDIDNGQPWHYSFVSPDGLNIPFKLRMAKSGGKVSEFEMFLCMGAPGSQASQLMYLSSTTSGSSASNTSVFSLSAAGISFGGRMSAIGEVDENGQWLSKQVTAERSSSGSGSNYGSSATLTQYANYVVVSAYSSGSHQSGNALMDFSNSYYSMAEILNPESLDSLALGDGSAKYNISFSYDANGDGDTGGVNDYIDNQAGAIQSWNGDTYAPLASASDGTYYSDVSSATPPTAGAVPSVAFSSAESWDCSAGSANLRKLDISSPSAELQADLDACDRYEMQNRDWINCSAIEN